MNTAAQRAMQAYSSVGLQTGIVSASPHRLIAMLFDGARIAIANAKGHMARNEIAAKGESVSKAIAIIDDGLNASLDVNVGGELALNLRALYEYMSRRLIEANLRNDPTILDEVSRLLGELQGAWNQIGSDPTNASGGTAAFARSAHP